MKPKKPAPKPVCCKCQADYVKKEGDLCETCEDSFRPIKPLTVVGAKW